MVLMLYVHPSRRGDLRLEEQLIVDPDLPVSTYIDMYGNRCGRLLAPVGNVRFTLETLIRDSGKPDAQTPDAGQHRVEDLPDSSLAFLLASRYCEVDKMSDIAWKLFGSTSPGWPRVQAICDWVHNHITFGYHFADSTKTAFQVFQDGQGVCRDFMHLAIAFCRCMNIPARYATGYLGDIGVPPAPYPMDFSAWFEVYLGEKWHTFDARHNQPRIGRVLMAVGRDAADVAITTNFGKAILKKFVVVTEEVKSG
jgi:transglutaminase-like putative cysteine protease